MMLHLDMEDWLARYFVYSVAASSLIMVRIKCNYFLIHVFTSAHYRPQVWQLGTTYNFRFSRTRDVGISVYLVIVTVFFYTKTPLGKVEKFLDFEPQLPIAEIINPVFLADPLGALVGKNLTQLGVWNPKWVGDKTIGQMK